MRESVGALNGTQLAAGARRGRADMGQEAYHGQRSDTGRAPNRRKIAPYALNMDYLPIQPASSGAMVSCFARSHVLAKATLAARCES